MKLQSLTAHPHGLADADFDLMFTSNKPVIFAFQGYPALVHRLTYKRSNHDNFHVHGYCEEGTTTTTFDMVVKNAMDRFTLMLAAVKNTSLPSAKKEQAEQLAAEALDRQQRFIRAEGEDLPEIKNWI